MHGVGVRGMPMFVVMELFANGQNSLKNFSQIQIKHNHAISLPNSPTLLQNRYALLYLNEIIIKLTPQENPCPTLWHSYHDSVQALYLADDLTTTKRILRQFETALFDELGVMITWEFDNLGEKIDTHKLYDYAPSQGFIKSDHGQFNGEMILQISQTPFLQNHHLNDVGQIYRSLIDFLLDYQPLNSRKLWAEQLKYR